MAFPDPIVALSELDADLLVGALIKTAPSGQRFEISGTTIRGYTGNAGEATPSEWYTVSGPGSRLHTVLQSPQQTSDTSLLPQLDLSSDPSGGLAILSGAGVELSADSGGLLLQSLSSAIQTLYGGGAQGTQLDGNGFRIGVGSERAVKGLDFGTFNLTTDASGRVAVAHNLGQPPTAVAVMRTATGPVANVPDKWFSGTNTQFTVQYVVSGTGAQSASGQVQTGSYIALA